MGVMRSSGSTFDSEIWAKRSLVGQNRLTTRSGLLLFLGDKIRQGHGGKVLVHFGVQGRPQIMGHAAMLRLAVLAATALRGIQWFIHGDDHISDSNLGGMPTQAVTTPRPAHTFYNVVTA